MCGFAGFLGQPLNENKGKKILMDMGGTLIHRGPDDNGIWIDGNSGIGFVHRRLSIQDLGQEGRQPMHSHTGRHTIVFNGEIYNFRELRSELVNEGFPFRGQSDTEVLLAGITAWGIEKTINRSVGMFAFALWDHQEKLLFLCRDRLGEKPLYYGWQGKSFIFGSELKALKKHPEFLGEINRDSICLFLNRNNIGAPHSIYKGISKLAPASSLFCNGATGKVEIKSYWSLRALSEKSVYSSSSLSDAEALAGLETTLFKSIEDQMIADVPVGAFLSGGIDSSTVVALMQARSGERIKTYSVGFQDDQHDEATHAKRVAHYLGTDHTEIYYQPQDAIDFIPRLPDIYDEPFGDSSQLPSCLISHIARQRVKVALTGDGGDEIFGGYNRHRYVRQIWNGLKTMPLPVRKAIAILLRSPSLSTWQKILDFLQPVVKNSLKISNPGMKIQKFVNILDATSPQEIYRLVTAHWSSPADIVLQATEPNYLQLTPEEWPITDSIEHQLMWIDGMTYLPDDILTKVDRASMSAGLELRTPMLDHRLVEYAWKLPLQMKIRNGSGKWILKQLLSKYVPDSITDRPKMGFSVPIGAWLNDHLRDWAEDLLDESRLRQQGYLDPPKILQKWKQHKSGKRDWGHDIWNILMFQAWLEREKMP